MPLRYQSIIRWLTNDWRISWNLGPRRPLTGFNPANRRIRCISTSVVPREYRPPPLRVWRQNSGASPDVRAPCRPRSSRYSRSTDIALLLRGSRRDFWLRRSRRSFKSRLVPLHPSTSRALALYAQRRDALLDQRDALRGQRTRDGHFLLTGRGRRFQVAEVHKSFYAISRTVGLRGPGINRGPRLHDLRHRFATETLLRWSRSGTEIERQMPVLTTYLGHSNIADTYWYLSAHPELMRHAALRLERRWGGSR
jgi:hypothetical protein